MKQTLLFLLLLSGLLCQAQVNSVAIVGEALGGWPGTAADPGPVDAHQMVTSDGEHWLLENLTVSEAALGGGLKFRANSEWTMNWGSESFPNGIGTQDGANIICVAGTYDVNFNSTTGEYSFAATDPPLIVKLVGTATGTEFGLPLLTNDGVVYYINNRTLTDGGAQFVFNEVLYGGNTFPYGTVVDNTLSIPVIAGEYSSITINMETGEYAFTPAPIIETITISGSAVGSQSVNMTSGDGIHYSYNNLPTTNGELHFTNTLSLENYANTDFPSGIATLNGNPITVPSGTWNVTFNNQTKSYDFTGTANFPIISIVGQGVGGWPGSAENPGPEDLHQLSTTDGVTYTIYELEATVGPVKFRQDYAWELNWGDVAFPSGIGIQNGANIEITAAGTYTVTFNRITGEYSFQAPNTIAIVGTAVGGWPTGAVGEIDAHRLTSTDGIHFRFNDIELGDGEVKFRQNNSWEVFWGGTSLDGTLILSGPSIPVTAGTYTVTLNRLNGDYSLSAPIFNSSRFEIFPNPTNNVWNFVSAKQAIESIQIVDVLGKTVMIINPKDMNVTVDASSLNRGMYFAKISTANATETAKLIKN